MTLITVKRMQYAWSRALWIMIACVMVPVSLSAISQEKAKHKVETLIQKAVTRNKNVELGLLLLHSDKLDIHWSFTAGDLVDENSRYHLASIGKLFTSTLIGQLVDEGFLFPTIKWNISLRYAII